MEQRFNTQATESLYPDWRDLCLVQSEGNYNKALVNNNTAEADSTFFRLFGSHYRNLYMTNSKKYIYGLQAGLSVAAISACGEKEGSEPGNGNQSFFPRQSWAWRELRPGL
jgi:hypothetical protein